MGGHVLVEPLPETGLILRCRDHLGRVVRQVLIVRRCEECLDAVELRLIQGQTVIVFHIGVFDLDLFGEGLGAQFVNQDLDPRLVDIVPPAFHVVDPEDGLQIAENFILRQESADHLGDEGGAS